MDARSGWWSFLDGTLVDAARAHPVDLERRLHRRGLLVPQPPGGQIDLRVRDREFESPGRQRRSACGPAAALHAPAPSAIQHANPGDR
jgi:hypothetical protein